MPTYDYECDVCNYAFEQRQRFDDEPVAICPRCEGKARRVIRSVPVIFKGSGFYITDSRKGNVKEKAAEKKSDEGRKKEPVKGESAAAASH